MTAKHVFLHIGAHKTGTTSIQRMLHDNRTALAAQGIAFFEGAHIAWNHIELHMATMRANRSSPIKDHLDLSIDSRYRASVTERVRSFLAECSADTAVFSAEGMALLRHPDEIDSLARLFDGHQVTVIVYLRDRSSFLASYRAQLQRTGIAFAQDRASFAYVEEDSWIADWEQLTQAYARGFGKRNILTRSYEAEAARPAGVVPGFLSTIGFDPGADPIAPRWLNARN